MNRPQKQDSPRSVLVTGGSGVIGAAICTALAKNGWSVAVGYRRDRPRAEEVAASLTAAGVKARAVVVDLSQPEEIPAVIDSIESELGLLGVLVNNGVVWPTSVEEAAPFYKTDDDWTQLLQTNLLGTLAITRLALQRMVAHGWGRIISMSTDLLETSMPMDASYLAAKGGMTAAARALAWEAGPRGVTVNVVAPGLTTEKGTTLPEEVTQPIIAQTPMQRLVHAKEVAAGVAFLASDDAAAITGHVLTISGGH